MNERRCSSANLFKPPVAISRFSDSLCCARKATSPNYSISCVRPGCHALIAITAPLVWLHVPPSSTDAHNDAVDPLILALFAGADGVRAQRPGSCASGVRYVTVNCVVASHFDCNMPNRSHFTPPPSVYSHGTSVYHRLVPSPSQRMYITERITPFSKSRDSDLLPDYPFIIYPDCHPPAHARTHTLNRGREARKTAQTPPNHHGTNE